MLLAYANTPGPSGLPPASWPQASTVIRDPSLPTLVMFVHPLCPCSRSSIGELALLMASCQRRVATHIFFTQPEEMDTNWAASDLLTEARRIPGVSIHIDKDGNQASLFRIQTSGDTALYDTKGRLTFHGGITISRGHSGDNPGRDAIQDLLMGKTAQLESTPAFGCDLFGCKRESNSEKKLGNRK